MTAGARSRNAAVALSLAVAVLVPQTAAAAVKLVNAAAAGAVQDGASWATAFVLIQPAIDAAEAGDEVWVARGTYFEHLTLKEGVAVFGGFTGTEATLAARDWRLNETIVDGGRAPGSVVAAVGGLTAAARIDGFTLQNGTGDVATWVGGTVGAGVLVEGASPTIAHNVIRSNSASGAGGGISVHLGSPTIEDNVIRSNTGGAWGGGIHVQDGAPLIANLLIAYGYARPGKDTSDSAPSNE